MDQSLLFLPDISGFTEFVRTTEKEHSQHVISELLEVLIKATSTHLKLAEVEGDALFFYSNDGLPSQERLLAQVEAMFTAFYSHLRLLEKNRICPCMACSSAVNLQLKIIAHAGELQFITVQDKLKPFGNAVIEAHHLLKNSVPGDNYLLISKALAGGMSMSAHYQSQLFSFESGQDSYAGNSLEYLYADVDKDKLKLKPYSHAQEIEMDRKPSHKLEMKFPVEANTLLEYITNYSYRHHWVPGVDKFEYNENEVTRVGTEHVCVINGKHLDFKAVSKAGKPHQLVYGEISLNPPVVDEFCQFFIITPGDQSHSWLEVETYLSVKSPLKKLLLFFAKGRINRNISRTINGLHDFVASKPG